MGHKHLHELLGEDQEPFLLNSYIADRSFRINGGDRHVKSQLQLKKQRPAGNLRKGSCFFSFPDSPADPRRSPVCVDFLSPKEVPNSVFLHVPSKTASLLLEAALRIQSSSKLPAKPSSGLPGFRLFGSLLKRLTQRHMNEKAKQRSNCKEASGCERHCSYSGSEAESSSEGEEEDEKDENAGFESKAIYGDEQFSLCSGGEKFCESPFRFVLQRSPPTVHRTPEITSPRASSPVRRNVKDKDDSDAESLKKLTVGDEEEEEEKEQCSPVCVLEPPFDDDDDDADTHEHGAGVHNSLDYEGSFAIMQRAKEQLLRKLYRFEKLAELDPVELEKRLLEQDDEEDVGTNEPEQADFLVEKVMRGTTKLVEHLLGDEVRKGSCFEDREMVTRGVCKRLEVWREADFNRIDMMVERDLRRDLDGWIKRNGEQVGEIAMEIEVAIFGLMLEELTEQLVRFP